MTTPLPHPLVATLPVYSTAPHSETPLVFRASSNESAFPPPASVVEAATSAMRAGNRYPAFKGADLIARLSEHTGMSGDMIVVADGSLSLLQHLLTAFVTPGRNVVFPWRSYEAYPICVQLSGAELRPIPLTPAFGHDLNAMADAVDADTAAVILCNPNNPTGTAFGRPELERFLARVPASTLVVYDEAYREFVDDRVLAPFEATELLSLHPNLVVLRTFSKVYSLAGLRVGYLVAHPGIAEPVRQVIPPFPVSAPAAAAASAALGEAGFRTMVREAVGAERIAVAAALERAGLPCVPSHANFVWVPLGDASEAFALALREEGIAVRAFPGEGVRISVGEAGLADALTAAVAAALVDPA
jgi:histidinol-phosphate aminotransferase